MAIRKWTAVFFTLFLSTAVWGGDREPLLFSRAYLGFGIGVPLILGKHYINSDISDLTGNTLSVLPNTGVNIGKAGFIGSVHGGYGHTFPDTFYLGGEFFLEWYTLSTRIYIIRTFTSTSLGTLMGPEFYQIRVKAAFGLLLHAGWQSNAHSLIYLSLGPTMGSLRINSQLDFIILPGSPNATPLFSFQNNKSQSKIGFRAGLGTLLFWSERWAFRLEYLYTHYGNFADSMASFKIPGPNSFAINTTNAATFSSHAVTANVDFFF